jgi:hypothetical protein
MKIIFLDIDGPLIPGRAYTLPNQTKPLVMTFDPVAVGLLNNFAEKRGWKFVIHSSWLRFHGEKETVKHCVDQGLKQELFHEDTHCLGDISWRYSRVAEWLFRHPEVTHYMILDDEPYRADQYSIDVVHSPDLRHHLILVDFEDGIITYTLNQMNGRDFRRKDVISNQDSNDT